MTESEIRAEKQVISRLLGVVFNCPHLAVELRRLEEDRGTVKIGNQCVVCGQKIEPWKSQRGFSSDDMSRLPKYDKDLKTEWLSLRSRLYFVLEGIVNQKNGGHFWERYRTHLLSEKWEATRQAVIHRAKDMCEHCGQRPIEHVHHLTYDNFGDEKMEDLLGVCADCHIHFHPSV